MLRLALTLLSLISCLSYAASEEVWVRLRPKTRDGEIKVNAYHYTNAWGRREVRLEAATLPRFGKTNPILGYGRDTNDDGNVDAWFLIDEDQGLIVKQYKDSHPWGRPELLEKVFLDYESSARAHLMAVSGRVLGLFLMSINHSWSSERAYWQEQVDLAEFEMRLIRMKESGNLNERQWKEGMSIITSGYQYTNERLHKANNSEYFLLGAADVALWASGGVLVKWLGKGLAAVGRSVVPGKVAAHGKAMVARLLGKAIERNKARIARLRRLMGGSAIVVAANVYTTKFAVTLKAIALKNKIMSAVLNHARPALVKAAYDWKYYSLMTSTQLAAETMVNWEEVKDPNPLIVAENVLGNGPIMGNVAFMAADAYLMSAAWLAIKPKGIRIAVCAFIPVINSAVINIVIQGKKNYERLAVDMGWEAIIGNTQLRADRAALAAFEKLAVKTGKSALKHLGWAVVLLEQGAMFGVYSTQVGKRFDEEPAVQLVPVIAEDDGV